MLNLRTRLKWLEKSTEMAQPEPVAHQPGESAESWYRRLIEAPAVKHSGLPSNLTPEEAYRRMCGLT